MKWLAKHWQVLSGLTVAAVFIGQSIWNTAAIRTELIHSVNDATEHRTRLHAEDEKIHKRVDNVELKIEPMKESLVRIETQQQASQRTIDKMDKKLDRVLRKR